MIEKNKILKEKPSIKLIKIVSYFSSKNSQYVRWKHF